MSRDSTGSAEHVLHGASAGGGTRLVSEPAFDLLFSEIIAYTGSYVAHSAASHSADVLRTAQADDVEGEEDRAVPGADNDGGVIMEPSPASVGAGNAPLPVSNRLWLRVSILCTVLEKQPVVPSLNRV